MAMRAILFIDEECPPCQDAIEGLKEYIDVEEVEVMPIQEGLKQFDLGKPEGVPFLAIISPSTGQCINKIYFQDVELKEIVSETASETETEG